MAAGEGVRWRGRLGGWGRVHRCGEGVLRGWGGRGDCGKAIPVWLAWPGPPRAPQGRPVPSRVTGPQGPWGLCVPGADPSLPQRAGIRKGPRHVKQRRARSACEQRACLCLPENASRRARETETGHTAGGARAASGVTDSPPPLSGAVWLPGAQTQQTVPPTGAGCSCGGGPGTAVCRNAGCWRSGAGRWTPEGCDAGGPPCLTWRVVAGLADGGCGAVHEVKRAPRFHLPETGTLPMAARDSPVLPQARRAQEPPQQRAPRVSRWVTCDEVETPQDPGGTVRPTRSDLPRWLLVAPASGTRGAQPLSSEERPAPRRARGV